MKVILSAAVSLDGYLDDLSPERLKLSSAEDWAEVQKLRARCDAILVGAGTLRKDDPSLVIRDETLRAERLAAGMSPDIIKVVVSRSADLDPASKFFTEGAGRKIVLTCAPTDRLPGNAGSPGLTGKQGRLAGLADIIYMPEITAASICAQLYSLGCRSLMVEGGSSILTMFLAEGVADEFRLAVAPFFVGQQGAPRLVCSGAFPWGKDRRMKPSKVELLGDTTVIHLVPESCDPNFFEIDCDRKYMRLALDQSRKCVPSETSYSVGAVVITTAGDEFCGYTHETDPANHAEEEAVAKALNAGADLAGATIYSTMEPCSTRSSKPRSCSQLIIEHGFARVVYALKEPAYFVDCHGDDMLRNAGIKVDVLDEFAHEVRVINSHVIR